MFSPSEGSLPLILSQQKGEGVEEAHLLPKSPGQEATHSTSAHVSSARASLTERWRTLCAQEEEEPRVHYRAGNCCQAKWNQLLGKMENVKLHIILKYAGASGRKQKARAVSMATSRLPVTLPIL